MVKINAQTDSERKMPTWKETGYAAAREANERLRRDAESNRQSTTNDLLREIRDLLQDVLKELRKD
jgi:hypothetical protein